MIKKILLSALLSCPLLAHDTLPMMTTAPFAKSVVHEKHRGPHGARGHHGHRGKHGHPGNTGANGAPGTPGISGFAFTPADLWATDTSDIFLPLNTPITLDYTNVFLQQNVVPIGVAPYTQFAVTNTGTYLVNFFLGAIDISLATVTITLNVNGVPTADAITMTTVNTFLSGAFLVQLNAGDIISLTATSKHDPTPVLDTSSLNAWNRYIGVIRSG